MGLRLNRRSVAGSRVLICLDEFMSDHEIEPEITEAVQGVANRYGAAGLADLIAFAQEELVEAQRALEKLEPGPE